MTVNRMGLDLTVYDENGESVMEFGSSYSNFSSFRERLAESVGINLDNMWGFGGDRKWTGEETYHEILDHADNEGELTHKQCVALLEDFTPENREIFCNTVKGNDPDHVLPDYFPRKWDDWKKAVELCAECADRRIHFH
jgi:hypothetical protein